MNITEIRVKLLPRQRDKLRAFASITIEDALVVRDIKIIEGGRGLFVAMPSRKLCDRCMSCGGKNELPRRYCGDCGIRLDPGRGERDDRGKQRLYADVAHPIHQRARDQLEKAILSAYHREVIESQKEGYREQSFDDLDYHAYDDRQVDGRQGEDGPERGDGESRPPRGSRDGGHGGERSGEAAARRKRSPRRDDGRVDHGSSGEAGGRRGGGGPPGDGPQG